MSKNRVTSLRQELDDPNFPVITYRRGTSGWVTPVIRGTGIRIHEAQAFYNAHRAEIDASIRAEQESAGKRS